MSVNKQGGPLLPTQQDPKSLTHTHSGVPSHGVPTWSCPPQKNPKPHDGLWPTRVREESPAPASPRRGPRPTARDQGSPSLVGRRVPSPNPLQEGDPAPAVPYRAVPCRTGPHRPQPAAPRPRGRGGGPGRAHKACGRR